MQLVPTGPLVRAPASSANLGPGFDTLGLALDLPFEVAVARVDPASDGNHKPAGDPAVAGGVPAGRGLVGVAPAVPGSHERPFMVAEPTHPVVVAFRRAGGSVDSTLLWRSPIPPGRGLGYSGAARVAGAYLAAVIDGVGGTEARQIAFTIATELEGHGDNAAASTYGGLCVAGDFGAVRVSVPDRSTTDLRVITWSPDTTTSTASARSRMPDRVPLSVAISSIERTALWVAAMSDGRTGLLREACMDQIHQPLRLESVPVSADVLAKLLAQHDVLAGWLSGSGPSVAAMVHVDSAEVVAQALTLGSPGGFTRVLRIDGGGVRQQPVDTDELCTSNLD